jgi:hypothetical protein
MALAGNESLIPEFLLVCIHESYSSPSRSPSASTGKACTARAVLLFPGWYVEQGPGTTREVWVLEPKALPEFLANESIVLKKKGYGLGELPSRRG